MKAGSVGPAPAPITFGLGVVVAELEAEPEQESVEFRPFFKAPPLPPLVVLKSTSGLASGAKDTIDADAEDSVLGGRSKLA